MQCLSEIEFRGLFVELLDFNPIAALKENILDVAFINFLYAMKDL